MPPAESPARCAGRASRGWAVGAGRRREDAYQPGAPRPRLLSITHWDLRDLRYSATSA